MRRLRYLSRFCLSTLCGAGIALTLGLSLLPASAWGVEPSIDNLKARLSSTSVGDRPHLCVQIAKMQMEETDKFYAADNVQQAQTALTDVVAYAELARDYAIQSHKYQKQTEIAVRVMARRLSDLAHSMPHDYQPPLRDALKRLQRVRDDLLASMFPQGAK